MNGVVIVDSRQLYILQVENKTMRKIILVLCLIGSVWWMIVVGLSGFMRIITSYSTNESAEYYLGEKIGVIIIAIMPLVITLAYYFKKRYQQKSNVTDV